MNPSIAMWINIAATVISGLTAATAELTDLFGQGPAQKIAAGIGIAGIVIGSINTALHATSPQIAGPLSKDAPSK